MNKKRSGRGFLRWLIFAVVVTALVSTTTLSRYMTTVTGKATATVASVDMTAGNLARMGFDIGGLKPGDSTTYTFNVCNFNGAKASDVTLDYQISVSSTGNLPLTYALENDIITSGTSEDPGVAATPWAVSSLTGSQNKLTTLSPGTLPHSVRATHQYTLIVSWPADKNDASYASEIDHITVTVDAQQAAPETVAPDVK